MDEYERKRAIARKRRAEKRKKQMIRRMVGLLVVLVVLAVAMMFGITKFGSKSGEKKSASSAGSATDSTDTASGDTQLSEKDTVLAAADLLAQQYDYDGAIEKLAEVPDADSDSDVATKKQEYQDAKDSCVAVNIDEVTHIFYHTLVRDAKTGFGDADDPLTAGYQQWMTTIYEFNNITQSMYDRGYVMVRLRDLVNQTTDEDGTVHFTENTNLMLPEDKKAFVLSVDDLSYYHCYDGRGMPSKLIIGDDGKLTNEFVEDDGTVSTGDYDVLPLMDKFLEEHPDASYKGAKGLIALTGYNGILGYRTDGVYESRDPEHLDDDQKKWLDAHPDFDYDQECEDAKNMADFIKEDGWEFASHTWGHRHIAQISYETLVEDTEKWEKYVSPLVGGTDTIIFAHGEDLTDSADYSTDDEKFAYLKSQGYNFYCNVDSTQYFLQIRDNYVRQGRRDLDGYRLYQDKIADEADRKTTDLFDIEDVYDPDRADVPDL